jgi:hypothetical protein
MNPSWPAKKILSKIGINLHFLVVFFSDFIPSILLKIDLSHI